MSELYLVTGSSGFIGTHLVRRLVNAGKRVICIDIKDPRERLEGAVYNKMDVRDLSSLQVDEPVAGIYNFAAIHTTPGHETHEYYETNISGALEVTRLAERLGVNQIVFTSSISVYGPSEETKTEASQPSPVSSYGYSKWLSEKIHRAWFERSGDRRLTIVRPAVVFGQGEGGNFARMASLLKKGFFIYPGRKDTIKACIFVEDLLNAIEFAHQNPDPLVTFNGSYPGPYTIEQIVATLIRNHFPRARTFLVPEFVVHTAAKILGSLNFLNIGIHPDRVTKLVKSTDVRPGWLESQNFPFPSTLDQIMQNWADETNGTFV